MNLIGSIHKNNYDDLVEIAVFDLGMTSDQIEELKGISKVRVFSIRENNPNLLSYFSFNEERSYLGWYAWKPVAIKESLEIYPYVLWLDAGCEVLKPLNDLFAYIAREGYFLMTSGQDKENLLYPLKWGTTQFVKDAFHLSSSENAWILDEEFALATFLGVSQKGADLFLREWYELTKDIRNFADDGTTGGGWGTCRHDQTLLSILSHLKRLKMHVLDGTLKNPALIRGEEGREFPFYVTWILAYQRDKVCIALQACCYGYEEHIRSIRYERK